MTCPHYVSDGAGNVFLLDLCMNACAPDTARTMTQLKNASPPNCAIRMTNNIQSHLQIPLPPPIDAPLEWPPLAVTTWLKRLTSLLGSFV